jgi:DNA-binding transcriptional MerR regulator
MRDDTLYTLREIARHLDLPESTVRYYRDAFAGHIPTVGQGRRRRYPREALEVLAEIARLYANGKTREAIEVALGAVEVAPTQEPLDRSGLPAVARAQEEFFSALLEGERERQEVMWQMAREIVRLGEAVERQHVILGGIVEQLAGPSSHALPTEASASPPAPSSTASSAATELDVTFELERLREELAQERELVERLRRGKLELERRAAEAETFLEDQQGPPGSSIFARFRGRTAADEERR